MVRCCYACIWSVVIVTAEYWIALCRCTDHQPNKQTDRKTDTISSVLHFTVLRLLVSIPLQNIQTSNMTRQHIRMVYPTRCQSEGKKQKNLFCFLFLRRASEAEDLTWQTEGWCRDYRSRFISHPYLKMLIILAIKMIKSVYILRIKTNKKLSNTKDTRR